MRTREPILEKSRSVGDLQHTRLMTLLEELVRDKGSREAAQALGVDHRTLAASLESGRLSRRMRTALEKELLSGGGSPAAEQRERNDELEGRVEKVEGRVEELSKDTHRGLAAVQGEVKALRSEHAQEIRQLERRLAQVEAGGGVQGAAEAAIAAVGKPKRRPSLRREYPELVTLEPADDGGPHVGGPHRYVVLVVCGPTTENSTSSRSGLVAKMRTTGSVSFSA